MALNRISMTGASQGANVAILVVSCDAYHDVWHPFFHCFFKYWPDCPYPLFLGSNYVEYADRRVSPILVGRDVDYTSNLIRMLDFVEEDRVIIWIEDLFPCTRVDTTRLSGLIELAKHQRIGYLKLLTNYPLALAGEKTQEVFEIPKGVRYRISFTVGLWSKDLLLKLLRPGETAWDIERRGSQRSNKLSDKFCYLHLSARDNPPLSVVNGVQKGRWTRNAIKFLKQEGLQDCLKGRPVQTFRSYLYAKAYHLRLDLYSRIGRQW